MTSPGLQTSYRSEEQRTVECVHYWIIDVPSGPISGGKCRICGEVKQFSNHLETLTGWEDERVLGKTFGEAQNSVTHLLLEPGDAEDMD